MSLLQGLGRAVTRAGSSRKALYGVAGVAGLAGLGNTVTGAGMDAMQDVALGDPEADAAFLGGRGLSPGTILDSTLGPNVAAAGTIAGSAVGALGGGALGLGVGAMLKDTKFANDVNVPAKFSDNIPIIKGKKVPLIGGENLFKAGKGGKGKIAMGIAGAIAGAGLGATAYTASHVNRNRDFYRSSPYSRGSAMQASSTQAYGDMVLGMHNSRRG